LFPRLPCAQLGEREKEKKEKEKREKLQLIQGRVQNGERRPKRREKSAEKLSISYDLCSLFPSLLSSERG
jgi:hypothetical protein